MPHARIVTRNLHDCAPLLTDPNLLAAPRRCVKVWREWRCPVCRHFWQLVLDSDGTGLVTGGVGNRYGRWPWSLSVGGPVPLAAPHVHCTGDPIECGVQALEGEYFKRQRDVLLARLAVATGTRCCDEHPECRHMLALSDEYARERHLSPYVRSSVMERPLSVTLAQIAEQREKGWPDFHPEAYCVDVASASERGRLGVCACGSSWFVIRRSDGSAGGVCIDASGHITGRHGNIACRDCEREFVPDAERSW